MSEKGLQEVVRVQRKARRLSQGLLPGLRFTRSEEVQGALRNCGAPQETWPAAARAAAFARTCEELNEAHDGKDRREAKAAGQRDPLPRHRGAGTRSKTRPGERGIVDPHRSREAPQNTSSHRAPEGPRADRRKA